MNNNNIQFLKGIAYVVGINILINILPSPWGLIAFLGIAGYSLWELWKYTRGL